MLIKILRVLTLFVCFSPVLALEVEVLNQGSCHMSLEQKSDLKVASFNDGKAFNLMLPLWQKFVDSIEARDTQTFVHCSGQGARVVLNFTTNKGRECIWAQVKNGELDVLDRDLSQFSDGPCDGVLENNLIVAFKKNGFTNDENFMSLESDIGVAISDSRELAPGVFEIEFDLSESEMNIFEVQKILSKNKSVRILDLVTRQRPIGDYREVIEFSN